MVAKRGFIRIVEATIAIVLILGAILILRNENVDSQRTDFAEILPAILNEIARNESFRKAVAENASSAQEEITTLLNDRINNPALDYSFRICDLQDMCDIEVLPENSDGEIYSAERVISASIEERQFSPKKIKIFLWRIK